MTGAEQRTRKQQHQVKYSPWGMLVLLLVAGGSAVFFFKSSSFLNAEFMASVYNSDKSSESGQQGQQLELGAKTTPEQPKPVKSDATEDKQNVVKIHTKEDEEKTEKKQVRTAEQPKPTSPGEESKGKDHASTAKTEASSAPTEGPERNTDETSSEHAHTGSTTKKPLNVIILYPDDWRHNDIGGVAPVVRTPFLNRLAQEGIRFTHNCVTTAICWISRATLFTGQYVSRHHSTHLKYPRFTDPQNWNHTWPYILQTQADYYTGHIGKWQFWDVNNMLGKAFNFTSFFEGRHWYNVGGVMVHGADHCRNETIRFLRNRPKDKPFALTVAFYPPKAVGLDHKPGAQWSPIESVRRTYDNVTIPTPYENAPAPYTNISMEEAFQLIPEKLGKTMGQARGRWRSRWQTPEQYQEGMKNYYSLITQVDKACEEIVDEIKAQGLYENTLIIFTTDHGLYHGAHGLAGKWQPYEESIRNPLIVYDPRLAQEKRGTLDDSFTLNLDLAETVLAAAGLDPDPGMQGRDISDLYLPKETPASKEPWREEFFYEFPQGTGGGGPKATALVRKEFKYMYWQDSKYEQLFNLQDDPLEFVDLWNRSEYKNVLDEMRKRHDELKLSVI